MAPACGLRSPTYRFLETGSIGLTAPRGGLDAERANRFSPDPWMNTRADYRFNHFSNGRQSCAGKDLALFIAKTVLANLLKAHDYRLLGPALNPDRQIPHAFNYFRLILSREPRART